MRRKQLLLTILGCSIFFLSFRLLFEASEEEKKIPESPEFEERVFRLRKSVESLEQELGVSKKEGENILSSINRKGQARVEINENVAIGDKKNDVGMETPKYQEEDCLFSKSPSGLTSDLQMVDVYNLLAFDNVDGGVWKQGFDINYDISQWSQKPLKVFVVPHSHNDPGWLRTFENYYTTQTRNILNNMVEILSQDSRRKFIWAEISYLDLWWNEQSTDKKEQVKRFIRSGQLEIVTGGWVMNDEANTFYYAMIDQLIEGHEWIKENLGIDDVYIPKDGWAIDPFGHTPTMAYILKRMDFDFMLIQRVHYGVKKYLAKNKNLEFQWRQNWDHGSSTDMFCHMMPFYSYDIPHTCGPDPKVCCQFDFRRLPGGGMSCPWRIPPVAVTDQNVAERANILLDQYRKKAQLYRSNVLLVPLGDDFRYDVMLGAQRQFSNYEAIFRYVNSHPELHAQLEFGTLSDYVRAVQEDMGSLKAFPKLSGDFYTYSDRDDNYWSGYYTARPFHKNLDRVLESTLRSAEIIYSFAVGESRQKGIQSFPVASLHALLTSARRNLGLFQHHDGITGTAKPVVVIDYGQRLLSALTNAHNIIKQSAQLLLLKDKSSYLDALNLEWDEVREAHDSLPLQRIVTVEETLKAVYFYNSLEQERREVVCLRVSTFETMVKCKKMEPVKSQINLVWTSSSSISKESFEICFQIHVSPFGLQVYYLVKDPSWREHSHPSTVTIHKGQAIESPMTEFQVKQDTGYSSPLSIKNDVLSAQFSLNQGLLKTIETRDSKVTTIDMQFLNYGTRQGRERSGAYLFLPDGAASPVSNDALSIRVTHGVLVESVVADLPRVTQKATVFRSKGLDGSSVHLYNQVDIRDTSNFELVMRLRSSVKNLNRVFYTDLNGFQIQRRQTLDKLPLQANFYPIPSMAYIEDSSTRLTLLSNQPLGFSSLETGFMEVVLDRRLMQDDARGLGEGVKDNRVTPSDFRLLVEHPSGPPIPGQQRIPTGYPSLLSHLSQARLMHPVMPLFTRGNADKLVPSLSMANPLPCDIHLLNLRFVSSSLESAQSATSGLLLHRKGYDCRFPFPEYKCTFTNGKVFLGNVFRKSLKSVKPTSLTLMKDEEDVRDQVVHVNQMEINAYKVTW